MRVVRPFHQHLGHQASEAIRLRRLREQSAAKNRHHRDERKSRILPHEKPQPVGELELLHLAGRDGDGLGGFCGERAARV